MKTEEFRAAQARAMSEADLQRAVISTARLYSFELIYHTFDSRRSQAGFPDLVLASSRHRRVVFAELKSETGRVTAEQQRWVDVLNAAGHTAAIWRPRDLLSGQIAAVLRATQEGHTP